MEKLKLIRNYLLDKEIKKNNDNHEKITNFIDKELTIIENVLESYYKHLYNIYYDKVSSLYFINLQKELIKLNKFYNTKIEIINLNELEKNFENEFSIYLKNEFYVSLKCCIIWLFYENINKILFQKCNEKFNEEIIINQEIYLKKEIEELKNESLKNK